MLRARLRRIAMIGISAPQAVHSRRTVGGLRPYKAIEPLFLGA